MQIIRTSKSWWRTAIRVLLALAGVTYSASCGQTLYGPMAPLNGDPTVEIVDFTYEPAGTISSGTAIVFHATLNKPVNYPIEYRSFNAVIGDAAHSIPHFDTSGIRIELRDDGGLYDTIAGDLIYSGALEWRTDYGFWDSLPVSARLDWWDDTPDVVITGEPLTVVEGVE